MNDLFQKQRLICDAPGCGHEEAIAEMSADYIGKPCPKCGASLLTQEDYDLAVRAQAVFRMLEQMGLIERVPLDTPDGVMLRVHAHDNMVDLTQLPPRNKLN